MSAYQEFKDYFRGKRDNMNMGLKNFPFKLKTAIVLTILAAIILYFIYLPAINLRSQAFWFYLFSIQFILILFAGNKVPYLKTRFLILIGSVVLYLLLSLSSATFFTSRHYAKVIQVSTGDFESDIEQLPIDKIPTQDRDSAQRLASRTMGELLDIVSQFDLEDIYTQINYQDKPVRVSPLSYDGLLKYFVNFRQGIPGYMMIDIVNGNSDLVKLKEGIKYSHADLLFRNITLYTRLKYPFDIFDEMNFEVDDEGTPFWIIPTYKPKVGFFGAYDVKDVITVNAITGDSEKYPVQETPAWIDRVYNADNIMQQLDWYGMYKNGYWNSRLGQKGVLKTTEGYNYLALDDDIYLYTGFTSVSADESNVGFILTNLRSKETSFYPVSSAKEISAMESAEGAVQEKNYKATFPLLLNIDSNPTYFLSLKDNAGLIKQFAFIDSDDYQNVAVGSSVREAYEKHTGKIPEELSNQDLGDLEEINLIIPANRQLITLDGDSYYAFSVDGISYLMRVDLDLDLLWNQDEKESKVFYKQEKSYRNILITVDETN